jgi:hypothetical protein
VKGYCDYHEKPHGKDGCPMCNAELPPDDVCCCGDMMENHLNAFDAGHTPVSQLDYYLYTTATEAGKGKA